MKPKMNRVSFLFTTKRKWNLFSWAVSFFEKVDFSHACIMYDTTIFQATGDGVHLMPLSEFWKINRTVHEITFLVDDFELQKIKSFAAGCVGKEYSTSQLIGIVALRWLKLRPESLKPNGTGKYICSELCADVASHALKMDFNRVHDYITPRELFEHLTRITQR